MFFLSLKLFCFLLLKIAHSCVAQSFHGSKLTTTAYYGKLKNLIFRLLHINFSNVQKNAKKIAHLFPKVRNRANGPYASLYFNDAGIKGMAPCCVQTKALTFTARSWASFTDLPNRSEETKVAVNESPAPTVSATSTLGVPC